MTASFYTVRTKQKEKLTIQKSIFIAHVAPVDTEAKAKTFIKKVQETHVDAAHNVFAYRIGENGIVAKQSDDNEPAGTAGKPVLEMLEYMDLTNTVVVITRYFGGIKLGAGGLVRAYRLSAKTGIEAAGVVTKEAHQILNIELPYSVLGKLQHELSNHSQWKLQAIEYMEYVQLEMAVPTNEKERFLDFLYELTSGGVNYQVKKEVYL